MTRNTLRTGSPVLYALVLVALVSLSARWYYDHSLTRIAQASQTVQEPIVTK